MARKKEQVGAVETTSFTDKVVFLSIHFGRFGNSRKVKTEKVEIADGQSTFFSGLTVRADKDRLNVTKHLLDSKILHEITSLDGKILGWVKDQCLPYEEGTHVLPLGLVEKVDERLRQFTAERNELVNQFVLDYPGLLADARQPLGDLFDENDYATAEEAGLEFQMRWNYLSITAPGKLGLISPQLLSREKEKLGERMNEAYGEWRTLLRVAVAEMTERLRDSLLPGENGKTRKLTESSVSKLQSFLDTFSFRNVTNDEELRGVTDSLKAMMEGITTDKLRESENLKASLGERLKAAASTLSVMTQAIRKFHDD